MCYRAAYYFLDEGERGLAVGLELDGCGSGGGCWGGRGGGGYLSRG